MTVVDLSVPPPLPPRLLEALPRRVALTLPELRHVAAAAGGAPLPFEVAEPSEGDGGRLTDRLGAGRATAEDAAYAAALASLHDPATSLARRGLLVDGELDAGVAGAVGLLARPDVALDLDVAVEGAQARAWHRQGGGAVAVLATVDGVVFELAWFPVSQWSIELARVAALPEHARVGTSAVPAFVDVPFELADAAAEAVRAGRSDLLSVLLTRHAAPVLGAEGRPLAGVDAGAALRGLTGEARGRLRALVADVAAGGAPHTVGVASWTLLADGRHALCTRQADDGQRVVARLVEPSDLAADLAPVLAQVLRSAPEAVTT